MHRPIQYNQLLFSQHPPNDTVMPSTRAVKFNRPQPIIFQKLDVGGNVPVASPEPTHTSLHLSALSEQSLSEAVRLAKFDLKQKREKSLLAPTQSSPKKATKSQKKQSRDKIQKSRAAKKPTVASKHRSSTPVQQTPSSRPNTRVTVNNTADINRPVAPHSPPVRDSDPHQRLVTEEASLTAAICGIREQMGSCIQRLHQLSEVAREEARVSPEAALRYHEDIEGDRRRRVRVEELVTRSSRTLYQLSQQSRQLHELTTRPTPPNQKRSLLVKMKSVHQGALRVLQTLVHHLADFDVGRQGLPRCFWDLGQLIRQLSLSCAQLGVSEMTSPLDTLVSVLQDERPPIKPVSQTRPTATEKHKTGGAKTSQRGLVPSGTHQRDPPPTQPTTAAGSSGKERQAIVREERKAASGVERQVLSGPERQSALKAGIEALLRDSARHSPSPPRSPRPCEMSPRGQSPVSQSGGREVLGSPRGHEDKLPKDVSHGHMSRSRSTKSGSQGRSAFIRTRGVLLTNSQRGSERRTPYDPTVKAGYADPTVASQNKQVEPHEWPEVHRSPSPRRDKSPHHRASSAPPSPLSGHHRACYRATSPTTTQGHQLSPRGSTRSRSPARSRDPTEHERHQDERHVHFDAESSLQRLHARCRAEKRRADKLRKELGQSEEWLVDAEKQLERKLHPAIEKAEEEMNVSLLADSLLCDLMEETLQEEPDEECLPPNISDLLRRLNDIECEQTEVCRRWASITYEDPNTGLTRGASYRDAYEARPPATPPPIEIQSGLTANIPATTPISNRPLDHEQGIIFTKKSLPQTSTIALSLTQNQPTPDYTAPPSRDFQPIRLQLSREKVEEITNQRQQNNQRLRNSAHLPVDRFNPWQIVNEVADRILVECVTDVTTELESISQDIVLRVCVAEFSHVPVSPPHTHDSPR